MKVIKIFLSSPGDVQSERKIAEELILATAEEFGVPVSVSYSSLLRAETPGDRADPDATDDSTKLLLCPYFWEYQRFEVDKSYQAQIPNTGDFYLVICILWSRLGTELGPEFTLPDGSRPRSGTEYEIVWALERARQSNGIPILNVYRNRSAKSIDLGSKDAKEQSQQWDLVQGFLAERLKDADGRFIGALNTYTTLDAFEDLFRKHFRDFLSTQLIDRSPPGKVKRWKGNPFRGLQSFGFEHSAIFYGRTKAKGEAMAALAEQAQSGNPFLLVLGASGSGKSSLAQAGILPLLVEPNSIPGVGLWRWAIMRPAGTGGDPFDALAAALIQPEALPGLADSESTVPVAKLAQQIRDNPATLAARIETDLVNVARQRKENLQRKLVEREKKMRAVGRDAEAAAAEQERQHLVEPRARLALIVDQLEELFVSGFTPEAQKAFVTAITSLVRSRRVFVVATLRSDFYARYQEFPELIELTKPQGKFDLRPPTEAEISNMMKYPAEAAGLTFEVEPESGQPLYDALRDAAVRHPESLPLLEHALEQLFAKQLERRDDCLSWEDYRAFGGLEGALAQHAEATFQQLQAHQQGAFPVVMRQLIALGQGEDEVINRRTVQYQDLYADSAGTNERAGAQAFVDLFIQNRLLVADTDPAGTVVVSVAHEALLRNWPRVQDWLKANREFLRMRDRLDASLQLWLSRGKQKEDLLPAGLPLAEGETLLRDSAASLGVSQVGYINASIAERHRQRRSRNLIRNAVAVAATGISFVLAALSGFAFWQKEEADRQRVIAQRQTEAALENAQLAQRQTKLVEQDEHGLRVQGSESALRAAQTFLTQERLVEALAFLGSAIHINPENHNAAYVLINVLSSTNFLTPAIKSQRHLDLVYDVAFSPDGSRFLSVSGDATARICSSLTGDPLTPDLVHNGSADAGIFSPDGKTVFTVDRKRGCLAWDAATGKLSGSVWTSPQSGDNRGFFSDDGGIFVGSDDVDLLHVVDLQSRKVLAANGSFDSLGSIGRSKDSNTAWNSILSPDASKLLISISQWTGGDTASTRGFLVMWDIGKNKKSWGPLVVDHYAGASFSPDGQTIVASTSDGDVELINAGTGSERARLTTEIKLRGARLSPTGNVLVTMNSETVESGPFWGSPLASDYHIYNTSLSFPTGGYQFWELRHNSWVLDHYFGTRNPDSIDVDFSPNIVFSPSGATFVELPAGIIYDGNSGVELGRLLTRGWPNDPIECAKFSPDGTQLLSGSYQGNVQIWNLRLRALPNQILLPGRDIAGFSLCQNGDRLAAYTNNQSTGAGEIFVLNVDTGVVLADLSYPATYIGFCSLSPDGRTLIADIQSSDRSTSNLIFLDSDTGKSVRSASEQFDCNSVSWSPDGRSVAAIYPEGVWVFNVTSDLVKRWKPSLEANKSNSESEEDISEFHGEFNQDGSLLFVFGSQGVWRLDVDKLTGDLIVRLPGVNGGNLSPDNQRIVTIHDDELRLWDAATGAQIGSPIRSIGIKREFSQVAFSPDSKVFVSACWNGTMRVWDSATAQPRTEEISLNSRASDVRVSKDGRLAVTRDKTSTIETWFVDDGQRAARPINASADSGDYSVSSDQEKIIFIGDKGQLTVQYLGPTFSATPDWLADLAEALCGWRVNNAGVLESIPNQVEKLGNVEKRIKDSPENSPLKAWAMRFIIDKTYNPAVAGPSPVATPVPRSKASTTEMPMPATATPTAALESDSAAAADQHLNEAYGVLRSKLDPAQKKALMQEELAWLKERDKIKDQAKKTGFIEARARELEKRSRSR